MNGADPVNPVDATRTLPNYSTFSNIMQKNKKSQPYLLNLILNLLYIRKQYKTEDITLKTFIQSINLTS